MKTLQACLLASAAMTVLVAGPASAGRVSMLITNNPDDVMAAEALTAAYTAAHPDVTFDIEMRTGGSEGDNIVKTRLATEEMADVFTYNAGSLFKALRPERTLERLDDLSNLSNIVESFLPSVSGDDGNVYGIPSGPAMGGGIFYNRRIYDELGLSVPTTWDAFMANNAKIAEAGIVPVAATYRSTWTSQIFVLADFYNVQAAIPDFAERYTANQIKYADTPAALRGFEHLAEVHDAGYYNEDFNAASYADGLALLASGEAAHFPMLTMAISAITQNHPDELKDIGFFAQPGDDADKNGLTIWMPGSWYVPKAAENKQDAKDFLNWVATVEACQISIEARGASGPYLVKGCALPDDVPPSVSDMMPYFSEDGRTAAALEYVSPIKGPALEQITVEIGTGIRSAADGAALYDQDVEKQAKQLGLEGW